MAQISEQAPIAWCWDLVQIGDGQDGGESKHPSHREWQAVSVPPPAEAPYEPPLQITVEMRDLRLVRCALASVALCQEL